MFVHKRWNYAHRALCTNLLGQCLCTGPYPCWPNTREYNSWRQRPPPPPGPRRHTVKNCESSRAPKKSAKKSKNDPRCEWCHLGNPFRYRSPHQRRGRACHGGLQTLSVHAGSPRYRGHRGRSCQRLRTPAQTVYLLPVGSQCGAETTARGACTVTRAEESHASRTQELETAAERRPRCDLEVQEGTRCSAIKTNTLL